MHTPTKNRIIYPTSDGRPMAETDLHRDLMLELITTLRLWFADEPTTYVSGNLLIFYEEGNGHRHVAPDVFVAFGVGNQRRDNYLIWEEGRSPAVVIELTSSSTTREDTETKMALYRDTMRVREYFLFDPREDYLQPSFQGFRLVNGAYRPMRVQNGRLRSQQLDLLLEREGQILRLVDPQTGQRLPTEHELRVEAQEQREHAEDELEQARALIARLQRENENLRRQ